MSLETHSKSNLLTYILIAVFILLISLLIYLFLENKKNLAEITSLQNTKNQLQLDITSTAETLGKERIKSETEISELSLVLSLTKEKLSDTEDELRDEKNRNDEFDNQIKSISGTVKVLDKLSKTDKELLQKYSRTYFLNENFVPMKLTKIHNQYIMPGKDDEYFHGNAVKFLEDMLDDAKDDGFDLRVISAYRSFDEQTELKGQYLQVYGSGSNAFSADQGYSEHQLGTTFDMVDVGTSVISNEFANTEAYKWLIDNAYRYGFILSYPENNSFYIYEPWHWRFVGVDLARDLHRADAQFYEWDQRKIDEYLIKIFD